MFRIGIDVGSTFTKYCVMADNKIVDLFSEKTVIRQQEYFERKLKELERRFPGAQIISCGYGKRNVSGLKSINELTALAAGCYYMKQEDGIALDIGGQDTKIIAQKGGKLKDFFLNDKCAAGSGMFLTSTLDMIGMKFTDIDLTQSSETPKKLSSTCAVFAQTEIVELIADDAKANEIIEAVIWQILVKTKPLISKVEAGKILITGGMGQIPGIVEFAERSLNTSCFTINNSNYLAAIGCIAEI